MKPTPTAAATGPIVAIVLALTTIVPSTPPPPSVETAAPAVQTPASDRTGATPIILAQSRCFNGRCY